MRRPTRGLPEPGRGPRGRESAVVARRRDLRFPAPGERGQASVELLGGLPALIALGLVVFQLFAVGYAAVLAGTAAEAGALAVAGGGDPEQAARDAVPGWSAGRIKVRVDGGEVSVKLRPPSPIDAISRRFTISARAAVER